MDVENVDGNLQDSEIMEGQLNTYRGKEHAFEDYISN